MVLHSVRQHTARLHHRPAATTALRCTPPDCPRQPVCALRPTVQVPTVWLLYTARLLLSIFLVHCAPAASLCPLNAPCHTGLLLPMLALASSDCRPARDRRWSVTLMDSFCPETNNQWVLAACACQLGLQNLALASSGSVRYRTNSLLGV